MKEEIMKRGMFAGPMSPETMNSGIMAGFSDAGDMEGEDGEEEGPEYGESEDMGDEEMSPMARTPQNPEILMNNLRGDMRSVDARYMELAQMVGQEAADQTPPEVLAMLMGQMGQQAGIGALPQGEAMQPPPMPGEAPMGAAPGGAPQMPPPGMEGMPPFPQGGAEEAPPTPDGMPPQMAAIGGLMSAGQRLAQYGTRGAEAVGRGATAANQYLGNLLMSAQPTMQRMVGPDGRPLTVQGRETLLQSPAGLITQGAGTRLAPYSSMGPLTTPTLTQGIGTAFAQGAERFPRAAEALKTMFPVAGLAAGVAQSVGGRQEVSPADAAEQERMQALMSQIPTTGYPEAPMRPGEPPRIAAQDPFAAEAVAAPVAPTVEVPAEKIVADVVAPAVAKPAEDTASFINAALKGKTKVERIKEAQKEYNPLFEELLGEDKDSAKTNALLLLAEAGFKLAGSTKPTFAMAVGEAAAGIPRGFAAIVAQAKDRDVKIKTAALQQAITDVTAQDKVVSDIQTEELKGAWKVRQELAKRKGDKVTSIGGGGRLIEDKDGSFVDVQIAGDDPFVTGVIKNPNALNLTDNPYVRSTGRSTFAPVEDKAERLRLVNAYNQTMENVSIIDSMANVVESAYSPKTFFKEGVNKILVPVVPNFIMSPNFDEAKATAILRRGFNDLSKGSASAAQEGRFSNQQLEMETAAVSRLDNPDAFWKDASLAAKDLAVNRAAQLNRAHRLASQLGIYSDNRVMDVPALGIKNDPFVIPADPAEQARMFKYLGSTIGKSDNPKARVFLQIGNATVPFTSADLRAKAESYK